MIRRTRTCRWSLLWETHRHFPLTFLFCDCGDGCFVEAILREKTKYRWYASRQTLSPTKKIDGYYLCGATTGFRRILFGETACDWNLFGEKKKCHQWILYGARRETSWCCLYHVPWKPCEENESVHCLVLWIPWILCGHDVTGLLLLVPHYSWNPCANDDLKFHRPDFP